MAHDGFFNFGNYQNTQSVPFRVHAAHIRVCMHVVDNEQKVPYDNVFMVTKHEGRGVTSWYMCDAHNETIT